MTDKKAGLNELISGSKGFAAILLLAFIPIIIFGINYLTKYTSKSNIDTSNFEIPYAIGVNLAKSFNPGKTWNEQKTFLYSIAAQTYNDEAIDTVNQIAFTPQSVIKVKGSGESSSVESLYDFFKNYCTEGRGKLSDNETFIRQPISDLIYNEAKKSATYVKYSTSTGIVAYESSKYEENKNKLQLSLNNKGQILVSCKELKRQAVVDIPRNNVDIVIAIPTNHASNTTSNNNTASFGDYTNVNTADSTPIKQIARACQSFLKPFLHTAGVAVGIIPYSGKITMSPYWDCENYTEQIPMNSAPSSILSYAVQAMFYASDGTMGGDIIAHGSGTAADAYGDYKNWGSSKIGLPIMARRGQEQSHRGMSFYSGALTNRTGQASLLLDMTTIPTAGENYKFMRMNMNPCYLGFCNTLAMTCEKDCPTYVANPYFMTGLTSDIQGLIYDLELFVPFKDERNKSNFLFLPLVMAGNMFSWGDHPSELSTTGRVTEPKRADKARAVVIIANAPDNFEPQEMTYLGFNNDYSEIPMIESDTILFNEDRGYQLDGNGNYMGAKGAVKFSASGTHDPSKGFSLNGTAKISFPNKGILRIVAEKGENSEVTVYKDNGVVDNVGTTSFSESKTLNFRGPQQVYDYLDLGTKFQSGYYTTKGPNFGHNLSTKKVKISFSGCKLSKATLSNQILRFYGTYTNENGQSLIENSSGTVWSGCPTNMKKRIDPCIDTSQNYGNSANGWALNSSGSNYYIKTNNFQPMCYGVNCINKFVCAANGFPTDNTLIPENAQMYDYSSSKWASIGNIKYDATASTMYRSFTNCYLYPSSNCDYVHVDIGKFIIKNLYYYKRFASQKTRSRTLKQRITTVRNYPTTSSSSCRCCQPNPDMGGALDDTLPLPRNGCNDVVYEHPDGMIYSQTGWTGHEATRYACLGNDQPQTWDISEFQKFQEQTSSQCSYKDGEIGNSLCTYPTEPAYDWISAIGNYSGYDCVNCQRKAGYTCISGCSKVGKRDVDIPSWEETISEYKRLYACYKRKDNGSLDLTYQVCDDKNGGYNCSSTSNSGWSNNFDVTGTLDNTRTDTVKYKFNLHNFFFVNNEDKICTPETISDLNNGNLKRNKGIYLLPDGSAYWVCFCGDGNLKLEFEDTYKDATVSFSHIETGRHRIAFDNSGIISNAAGVSKTNIDNANQQVFYIIPEQIKDEVDGDGNYYVELNTTGKIRIVSVELSNRPYKAIKPSVEIVGVDTNKGKAIGDGGDKFVEFKTDLKTSFSFSATPIYYWIEKGKGDFRQTSGTARIYGNSDKVSGGIVQAVVPDLGSETITLNMKSSTKIQYDPSTFKITEIPIQEYTITSDRKVKEIYNVPEFVIPKASFSGEANGTYEFQSNLSKDFHYNSSDHKPFNEKKYWNAHINPYKQTFSSSDKQKTINFDLQACSLKQVYAKNLVMKFSPTVNDFPSVDIASRYNTCDPLRYNDSLGFYADTCNYGTPYGIEVDLKWAYTTYGSGTITTYGYKNSGADTMSLYVNGDYQSFSSIGNYSKSGSCTGSSVAKSKVYYSGSKGGKYNYMSACEYIVNSYDLMKKLTYSSSDTTNHNYKGSIPFHGTADIYITIVPQTKKLTNTYSLTIPENGIKGGFGSYSYTWQFENPSFSLNLNSEQLKRGTHFDLAYTNGTFDGASIGANNLKQFTGISTTTLVPNTKYFYKDIPVKNVQINVLSNKNYMVDKTSLSIPSSEIPQGQTFTISPDTYAFERNDKDGYFHIKVPCQNVYISDVKVVDTTNVQVYAHPNIISENLKNTRIIDGYDQATNKNMKKYGNINYNNSSLPAVSAIQKLFYNQKANNNAVYLYPKASGSGSASAGEEGDFFIQIWDHNNEVPAVRWKIGSSIQSSTSDISVGGTGFGAFKSNYAFNGLHRMFFPYNTYSKTYAGYSYAKNSALVFAGYTLPINLILANSGYQTTYSLSSGQASNYTKPNTALSNLAKDACSKLKADLKNPTVYLVKYRVKSDVTLSLESCVGGKYTYAADNETDLTDILIHIAKEIKQNSQDDVLRINVKDLK